MIEWKQLGDYTVHIIYKNGIPVGKEVYSKDLHFFYGIMPLDQEDYAQYFAHTPRITRAPAVTQNFYPNVTRNFYLPQPVIAAPEVEKRPRFWPGLGGETDHDKPLPNYDFEVKKSQKGTWKWVCCALAVMILLMGLAGRGANIPSAASSSLSANLNNSTIKSAALSFGNCSPRGDPTCINLLPGMNPSVSVSEIQKVLENAGSPAAPYAQQIYDLGVKYGVEPAFAIGFFKMESSFGTTGVNPTTKNPGNVICYSAGPNCICGLNPSYCYLSFDNWGDGFDHWYWQITQYKTGAILFVTGKCPKAEYVDGQKECALKLDTVDKIVPTYLSHYSFSYAQGIKDEVSYMRANS